MTAICASCHHQGHGLFDDESSSPCWARTADGEMCQCDEFVAVNRDERSADYQWLLSRGLL